ncbi:cell surface protein precursor [Companilactobacillus kimchiensis]|uniref:Cell surface protein n=2 Tax=Companilactobacillus kimchiensis TaxID=993692 RepID=A0A0R2LLV3_9LACO|nr:cell surface protein precursor [Companilactobacillus kimchiensis]
MNSLVFSFVYTLSTYRLHDLMFRHDIGEIGAFVFLPIAVLGIYEIFYGERKHWLTLVFGMTGIIYSHAISPILVAILIIIIACCQIPELKKNPKRLLSLLWAVICSVLLSLAYFLPMIEQVHHTQFMLGQSEGMLPNGASDMADLTNWSLNNTVGQPNIGITLFLAAIVILVSFTKIKNNAIKQFSVIGAVMLLCSTKIFPWVLINKTPLRMIQYPWRFDMVATILLAIFVASDPLNIFSSKVAKSGLVIFVFLLAVSASYRLVANSSLQLMPYAQYSQLDSFSIGAGQEYLPKGTNLSELQRSSHKPKIEQGKVKISNFKQYGTRLSFDFKNAKNAKVDLPIIAYYGFQSTQSSGKVSKIKMDSKNNNLAQVTVNGKGKVIVDYFETATQKVTRRISFLSLLVIIALIFINKLNLVDFDRIEGLRTSNKEK